MLKFCILALLFAQIFALNLKSNLATELSTKGSAQVFINFDKNVCFKSLQKTKNVVLEDMDHSARGKLVVKSLKDVATASQKNVVAYLKANNIKYNAFYISNTICVEKAIMALLTTMKTQFAEIASYELVGEVHLENPKPTFNAAFKAAKSPSDIEAGVAWVKAPEVWAKGHTGKGITIGVIDTGAFLHDDLKAHYRGRNGDHSTSWLDATRLARQEPYDDNFHGTHCHGSVSATSPTVKVGVAPEAEWVSCKFLTAGGSGNYNDCLKCMEFMLAPGGKSDLRPHVVSNSYGGGSPTAAITRALDSLLEAGVEMVYAAGNSGSRCGSVLFPASLERAYSVGALNRNSDVAATFSSRGRQGPFTKPEIAAPGALVKSTSNRGGYRSASGTSMACPHVAGVIALLWSARPELSRKIKETREILDKSALGQETTQCTTGGGSPNNVYGYGTVNSLAAVETAERIENMKNLSAFR